MDDRSEKKTSDSGDGAMAEEAARLPQKREDTAVAAIDERLHLMAEFGIRYDGRHYIFDPWRYDHLADAVAFARLTRAAAALGPRAPHRKGVPRLVRRMQDAASAALSRQGGAP